MTLLPSLLFGDRKLGKQEPEMLGVFWMFGVFTPRVGFGQCAWLFLQILKTLSFVLRLWPIAHNQIFPAPRKHAKAWCETSYSWIQNAKFRGVFWWKALVPPAIASFGLLPFKTFGIRLFQTSTIQTKLQNCFLCPQCKRIKTIQLEKLHNFNEGISSEINFFELNGQYATLTYFFRNHEVWKMQKKEKKQKSRMLLIRYKIWTK